MSRLSQALNAADFPASTIRHAWNRWRHKQATRSKARETRYLERVVRENGSEVLLDDRLTATPWLSQPLSLGEAILAHLDEQCRGRLPQDFIAFARRIELATA